MASKSLIESKIECLQDKLLDKLKERQSYHNLSEYLIYLTASTESYAEKAVEVKLKNIDIQLRAICKEIKAMQENLKEFD